MFALTLADADAELIDLAGIEGKTGATGRHSPTRRYSKLNRAYRELRTRVSTLRYQTFAEFGSVTALPARLAGEDYIEITRDFEFREVAGIDVLGALTNNQWAALDPLDPSQRRGGNTRVPTLGGVGFWTTLVAPKPSTTSISDGKLAVWPSTLTGSYRLAFTSSWVDITTTTHVFMLEDAWDTWLLARAAMGIVTRDTNKRGKYDDLKDMWLAADDMIRMSSPLHRLGPTEPTPYLGIEL
jgi:hypothetical protein